MCDLIDRQAAIEAMRKAKDKSEAHRMLVQLPSAQLAQDLTKGCTDTISRSAVGDALNGIEISRNASWYEFYQKALTAVGELPSAQPSVSKEEMVGDAVSRQGVLRLLNAVPSEEFATKAMLISGVNALPSVQPGWIPWDSGKFPEESGTYTVTAYDGATKRVTYAKYQKRLKRWELTGARAYWRVLAWMPHIEPWEGERDE